MVMAAKKASRILIKGFLDLVLLVPAIIAALLSRFFARPIDIGMGPEPLISYKYHRKALEMTGYSSEAYVIGGNYITDDYCYNAEKHLPSVLRVAGWHILFFRAIFRYRCLYFSFHGGPLMGTILLRVLEPYLFRLAGIKTVILPYGSDVQDMTRCPNFSFRSAVAVDYPSQSLSRKRVASQIDRWTWHGNYIVAGCDWIDYLYHWDMVTLNNFSIDTDYWRLDASVSHDGPIRVLHSPNHRTIKGSSFFEAAVKELQEEGVSVELLVLERASNDDIRKAMCEVDIVADQLIIGWYAMFAMEGMALGKPVLCHIRPDLKAYYQREGLLEVDELPLVECTPENIKDVLKDLVSDRDKMKEIGLRSREFVVKHHSLQKIGDNFDRINRSIDLIPRTGNRT